MKFISNANPAPSEGVGYINEKSLVVPDGSLSLQQILERFVRGEEMSVGMPTYYDDVGEDEEGFDYEKIKRMDLTEIQELREFLKQKIESQIKISQPEKDLDNNRLTDTNEKEK